MDLFVKEKGSQSALPADNNEFLNPKSVEYFFKGHWLWADINYLIHTDYIQILPIQ